MIGLVPNWTGTNRLQSDGQIMRKSCRIALVSTLLLAQVVSTENCAMPASAKEMAAGESTRQEGLRRRDVLVAGVNSVASGKSAAVITIDFGPEPVPPPAQLELLLSPDTVPPGEAYLVVVSMRIGAVEKRLGTVSFFPPRPSAVRPFYFDVSPILAEMNAQRTTRIDLSIALVPANRTQGLTTSSVRVVGARLVDG